MGSGETVAVPPIVGRTAELAEVSALVDETSIGPRALLIEGEPGIGKTTLWEAGVSLARARGYTAMSCRPSSSELALSYAALGDLLEGLELPDELPEPQRHAFNVALLRQPSNGRAVDRRTISVACLGALRSFSARSPVLIAIDDAHWLDRSSATVLAFCLRRLRDEPISLIVARRTGGDDPLELSRWQTQDRLQRIWIDPLDVRAAASLISDRFGIAFPRPTVVQIHEASRGNPLFALELARALLKSDGLDGTGKPFHAPDDVRALLRRRIGLLSPAVYDVLLSAAATARPTVPLLQAVSARPERVEGILRRAASVDVIEVDGEVVRFTHPLFASAVYDGASDQRRRNTHRRLAEVVEDREERVRHLALCTPEPDAGMAAALEEAARQAIERGAPASAARLGEDAVRFTPPASTEDRRRRQLAAAEHHFLSGNQAAATRLAEAAVASSSPGSARALALERFGRIRMEDDLEEGARLLTAAVGEAGATERLRAEGLIDLAVVSLNLGCLEESERSGSEALELAERVGDDALVADAICVRALPRAYLGRGIDRESLARARDLVGATERFPVASGPRATLAELLVVTDELDEARPILIDLLATAEARGDEPSAEYAHAYLARLELRAGRWDEALSHTPAVALWGDGRATESIVHARRGAFDAARSAAEQTLESVERSGHIGPMLLSLEALGSVELVLGRLEIAHAHHVRAWDIVRRSGIAEPNMAAFLADWIETLIRSGDAAHAETIIVWLEERGRSLDRPRALATSARGRGRLAFIAGDIDAAVGHLDRALAEHDRYPDPFERGRTLLEMGMVRRRAKQKRPARESLDRAVAIFEELGATPWLRAARSEIAAIGGRAPAEGGLTPTEERVARLASSGLNNREIADRLFLSMRTVEGHLSHAYRKLGIRSRSQLRHVLEDERAG